ncbi:MAG: hypothetical protein Q9160_007086 [Pyrenula sp. 1 TL-2023]
MATIRHRDPNTLSNYSAFKTVHTVTNFDISFDQQQLSGNVVLNLESLTEAQSDEIILDSSHVDVSSVKVNGQVSKWTLLPRMEPYGSALKIPLSQGVDQGQRIEVDISLQTSEKCSALQWLTPAQTANKKYPYMFSQCQAIHARSCFPCQDTPDVKSTFEFSITSPLPVIASGISGGKPVAVTGSSDRKLYKFEQKVPIPSYLFALASGDIETAPVGPRSVIATSPERVEACKWELEADTENFIQAAEKIVFPYVWGTYNVLFLPPSFPYGGMENPVYTFATPSVISKDRANVDVIAHELAHAWSGNLVSNASWEHFWLNEGWTVYLERRILAAVHGEEQRDFLSIIGWKDLIDAVERFGKDHEATKLIVDLKGKDPDDFFSAVPYEKGFNFLYYLEKLIGKDKFDEFIPHYFTKWKGKSLDSYDFKSTLLSFFENDTVASGLLNELDWDWWFYSTGVPPEPRFDTSLVDVVYELADKWRELSSGSSTFQPSKSDIASLNGNQLVVFLSRILISERPLTPKASELMGEVYGFASSENFEITSRYYRVGMQAGDRSVLPGTVALLGSIGRMKFVRETFRSLEEIDRELALKTFENNRDFYHPICRTMVGKDLGLSEV